MENLPIRAPRRNQLARREDNDLLGTLSAFESETAGVLAKTSPRNERVIIHIVALMMALAVGLSAVVKLDRVVSGPGEVTAVGGPLFVSPLNAGVVMSIKVKPGDVVEKGQVLATMDPAIANAALTGAQQKLLSDEALIGRLTAEYNDQRYSPQGDNPFNEVQMTLWLQRQTEYKANVGAFDAQLASAQGLIEQYRQDVDQYRKRYQLAARRQAMVQPLVGKGYVSELQLNTAQDATEELARQTADSEKLVQQQSSTAGATRQQRAAFVQKWHSDVGTQLVAARNDRDATRQQLETAQKNVELNTLVSPSKAIVLKIANVSVGSVAGLGANPNPDATNPQLITLAPLDAPLEAEFDVQSRDVGFIRPGDPVTMKLEAYQFLRHGFVYGKIKSISEGSFTVDRNSQPTSPYFKVRASITSVDLHDVPKDFRLIPGMTLQADAQIGKRTILSYLIEGALRTGSEAMREAQ